MFRKKIMLFALCGVLLTAAGCSEKKETSESSRSSTASESAKVTPGKVELKTYEFPEFMNSIGQPDMLTSRVYDSFVPADHVSAVTEQPFEDRICTDRIDNTLYVFEEDRFEGLLNSSGTELIPGDKYTEIELCAPGVLKLISDPDEDAPAEYALYNNYGSLTITDELGLGDLDVTVTQVYTPPAEDASDQQPAIDYDVNVNGTSVCQAADLPSFNVVEQIEPTDIITDRTYSACYRAYTDQGYYFITVDRFNNFTVYDGAYAFVRLKVGDSFGQCYIFSSEDYAELDRMIKSFGSSSTAKVPSKDQELDYIQLETGLGSADRVVYTVSADGFCLTDQVNSSGEGMNKYFTNYDKESFVSLVQWIDQVLSEEYSASDEG